MKIRVFLDTNVFIYAFEFPKSNSRKIIELLNQNEIEAVISEKVLSETQRYFLRHYGKELANTFRNYLFASCTIIPAIFALKEMKRFRGLIKDKDLEQLAVTKELGLKYLISYDRDFEPFEEYKTPKGFLENMHIKSSITEF